MEVLGSSLTAYAVGLGETLHLHEWVAGKSSPSGMQMERLDLLHEVTVKLQEKGDSKAVVRAVMIGLSPELEDRQHKSIAECIHNYSGFASERQEIMNAVYEFLANG